MSGKREILARFIIQDDGSVTLERVADKAEKAERSLRGVDSAAGRAGREVQETGQKARKAGGDFDSLAGSLKKALAAAGGLYALKTGFEAIIGTGAKFETMGMQLKSIMGSLEAGNKAVDWITEFGATTPYQLEQVTSGFVRLKAMGLDPTDGTLRTIGDAVAAMGGSQETFDRITTAVGQIATKGKVSAEELKQLAEAGLPVFQILKEKLQLTGEEVANIGNEGVTAAEGLEALMVGLEERFGGAMAEQMNTVAGLFSNLQDQITLSLRAIAEGGGMDAVREGLRDLIATVTRLREDGTMAEWGAAFGKAISAVASTLPTVIQFLTGLLNTLVSLGPQLKIVAGVLAGIWSVQKVQAWGTSAMAQVTKLSGSLQGATTSARGLATAMGGITAAIGAAVLAGQALAAWFDTMAQDHLQEGTTKAWKAQDDEVKRLAESIKAEYGSTAAFMQKAGAAMGDSWEEAARHLLKLGQSGKWAGDETSKLGKTWASYSAAAKEAAKATGEVGEEVEDAYSGIRALGDNVEGEALPALETLMAEMQELAEAMQVVREEKDEWTRKWSAWAFEYSDLMDRSVQITQDFAEDSLDIVESYADAATLAAQAIEFIPDPKASGVDLPRIIDGWVAVSENMAREMDRALKDSLFTFMTDPEDLGEAFKAFGQNMGDLMAAGLTEVLADALKTGDWKNAWDTLRTGKGEGFNAAQAVGGAAMVYQGSQTGGWAGALQGALGAGSLALAIPGVGIPLGIAITAVGAILGALGGSNERPWTQAQVGLGGTGVTASGGGQGLDFEKRRLWAQKATAAYSSMGSQYRSILEAFGDESLFDLLGDMPSWSGRVEMTGDELLRVLTESILPEGFDTMFREAFRQGLSGLGVSDAMFETLQGEMSKLPGQDRLDLLATYVGVLSDGAALIDTFENLADVATETPWETWNQGFEGVMDRVGILAASWDKLDFSQWVEQGRAGVDLLTQWGNAAVQYLNQLLQLQAQMQGQVDSMRERLITRDMTDAQKSNYAFGQMKTWLDALETATDPTSANTAFGEAMRYLQMLEGLDTGGSSDFLLQWLTRIEGAMQGVMGGFTGDVEGQAQTAGDALQELLDRLSGETGLTPRVNDLAGEIEGAGISLETLDLNLKNATTSVNEFAEAMNNATGAAGSGGGMGPEEMRLLAQLIGGEVAAAMMEP